MSQFTRKIFSAGDRKRANRLGEKGRQKRGKRRVALLVSLTLLILSWTGFLHCGHGTLLRAETAQREALASENRDSEKRVIWEAFPDQSAFCVTLRELTDESFPGQYGKIREALTQAKEWDNLIFDLRGCKGASDLYWINGILRPLLTEPLTWSRYGRVTLPMELERHFMELLPEEGDSRLICPGVLQQSLLTEEERDQTQGDKETTSPLSLQWEAQITLNPVSKGLPYAGQVWLLVDKETGGAAWDWAVLSQDTGWGTLVGEAPEQPDNQTMLEGLRPSLFWPEGEPIHEEIQFQWLNPDGSNREDYPVLPDSLTQLRQDALARCLTQIDRQRGRFDFVHLSEQDKKADYEAFWSIVESSYPMLKTLEEKGAKPEQIRQRYEALATQVNTPQAWANLFQTIILELENGQGMTGHLSVVELENALFENSYQSYCYSRRYLPGDPWEQAAAPVFDYPQTLNFYDLEEEIRSPLDQEPLFELPNNVETWIDGQQNCAYLQIDSFLNEDPQDRQTILEFFKEAEEQQIGHMILDIRDNGGGYNDYWMGNIVSPNIREPLENRNFGLYQSSPWNEAYIDYYTNFYFESYLDDSEEPSSEPETQGKAEAEGKAASEEDEEPAGDVVVRWEKAHRAQLPELPALDSFATDSLPDLIQETLRVLPTEEKPLFTGKFWILADGNSYSASEYFLSFCKRTGFATFIGQPSAGDGSCVVTIHNALPNSGLVIRYNVLYGLNPDGSCSEERPTDPDIEIPLGEDALTRCLQEIQQWEMSRSSR